MSIKPILMSKMTKWKVLDKVLPNYELYGNYANLFIDVRSIIGAFFTSQYGNIVEQLQPSDKLLICSTIMNLAAHYRAYFWDTFKIRTRVFIIHSDEASEYATSIFPEYKAKYATQHAIDGEFSQSSYYIESNLKLLKHVASKCPEIYYIDSEKIEPNVVPLYIQKFHSYEDDINIVLSNEKMAIQYAAHHRFNILQMKGDKSQLITKTNAISVLTGGKRDFEEWKYMILPVLAIAGSKNKHGVPGLPRTSYITASKKVEQMLSKKLLPNIETTYDSFMLAVDEFFPKEEAVIIDRNYKLFDVREHVDQFTDTQKEWIKMCTEPGIVDLGVIQDVNGKYFKKNAININFLTRGENAEDEE